VPMATKIKMTAERLTLEIVEEGIMLLFSSLCFRVCFSFCMGYVIECLS
jgi:hypothetical protein